NKTLSASYANSSESLEQSFPAAAFSSCKITDFSLTILVSLVDFTFTYSFVFRTFRNSPTGADNVNSAPRALEALSLHHNKRDQIQRLEHLISSDAVLSSALAQNSSQLSCRPESRNIPVDFSSIPAISLKQKENGEKMSLSLMH
uniref:Uncharacterized protein n=1 Tax=Pelusios castaneus TaxID=367368 RepID=A0A8C8RLB9_9SAUR